MQKLAEVDFYAQKRLKLAKLLKNIEVSSKTVENRWLDWVLPLIIFAGPPRVVGLARRFTCACQLSAPNQVASPQNHAQSNKKILHKGGLLCWLETICDFRVIYYLFF